MSFQCSLCKKTFLKKFNLHRHIVKCKYGEGVELAFDEALFKCLEGCNTSYPTCKDLREHLLLNHNFTLKEKNLEFEKFADFKSWLLREEKLVDIGYFKGRGSQRNMKTMKETIYFYCSRTGRQKYISQKNSGQQNQGSSRLKGGCISRISVIKDILTEKCHVIYNASHYGHGEHIQPSDAQEDTNISTGLNEDSVKSEMILNECKSLSQQLLVNLNTLSYTSEQQEYILDSLRSLVNLGFPNKTLAKKCYCKHLIGNFKYLSIKSCRRLEYKRAYHKILGPSPKEAFAVK